MIKMTYIGTKVFDIGQHVVRTEAYGKHTSYRYNHQQQIFIPDGYRLAAADGLVLYFENSVSVEAKVYEKSGKRFSPEFGKPLKK